MIGSAQNVVLVVLLWAALAVQVFALVDAAARPATAYTAEGKLAKKWWLLILVVALAITFAFGGRSFLPLMASAPALVYLFDVRPRIKGHRSRRGGRGTSGGARGGW